MLARVVFALFVLLALLGDARVFLFVLNRVVFGNHRHEKNPWGWLVYITAPLLIVLTALFWIPWLTVAAAVGMYWILARIRVLAFPQPPLVGVRDEPPQVIRLRRAHIPFAILRRLGAHNDVYDLEITRHEIFIDDLPQDLDGYRVAFLTDTHVASFMRRGFYREIVAQVQQFEPHVVLLGGDFVTWRRHTPLMAEVLLTNLQARDGVFAVLGNHDYWAGAEEVMRAMTARGAGFLINESVKLPLQIVGIDEIYRGNPDVDQAFAGVDLNQPCLGLSHHPDVIDFLGAHRLDLLLCGHTHGGQIRFPFFGAG